VFLLISTILSLFIFQARSNVVVDLREGDQDVILFGLETFDGLSYPVFAKDINGDGLKDLIMSATASDGPDHSEVNCGAIYVIFGKDSLPASSLITAAADLIIYGAEHGIHGIEGDEAGYALASADFNHDGLNDIITSALYADGPDNSRPNSGEVYIIYGRHDFPEVMDLSADADVIIYGADGGDAENPIDPDDPDEGDLAGYSLATGDLNNDGWNDLVIGAVLGDGPQNTRPHGGETYILWGQEVLPAIVDLASDPGVTTLWGGEAGDYTGFVLLVKNLNGDSYDDLIIGGIGADGPSNSRPGSGEFYVFVGRDSFPPSMDLATDADMTIFGAEAGDQDFNPVNYINAADVNGDGLPDLVIGAPYADGPMNGRVDSGEAYIVFGRTYLPPSLDLAADTDVVLYGINAYDHAGFSIAAGDVNGDNLADIAIGAVDADGVYDVRASSGEVYLIYGRGEFGPEYDLSQADLVVYGADPYDLLGVSTDMEDVNNDGIDDILIGAPLGDGLDNLTEDAGEALIVFGASNKIGLEALSPRDGEVCPCQPEFTWTFGRPENKVWVLQMYESPTQSHLLHTSPFLLEPAYTLPDNFLMTIPADRVLYWKVYAADPERQPLRVQQSQVFSFTRMGLHLVLPVDSTASSSALTLEWTHGCPGNGSWVVGISDRPDFGNFLVISPVLGQTSWIIPDSTWQALPSGIPLYWKVLGFTQPVPWRVSLDWSQEVWSFTRQ
jgi:hypothetical protein